MNNTFSHFTNIVVLALSVLLIFCISLATFSGQQLTDNAAYMRIQLSVCIVFMLIFFADMRRAQQRTLYFVHNLPFLLISIPYLNIIAALGMPLTNSAMQYLHFIPLLRGAYVMILIINAVSTSRIMSFFLSYLSIVVLMIYFSSLLFYMREHAVNPAINGYLTSVWWCCLQFTTIGAPIDPVTPTGKVLAFILAAMGVIMFPLFTVYLTRTGAGRQIKSKE
jgi:hypothetical protein